MPLNNDQWQEAIVQLANNGISASDTYGTATNITAATTFSGVPTISQIAANSFVLLANPGNQATFIAEINVASAFVGTLSFYGLEPDGATLQAIGTHQRGATTLAMSTAINTGVALNQTWMGSAANFKSIYVVCTAFTSGSVSVQLGLTAAPYAMAILNALNLIPFQDTQATGTVTNANDVVSIALPGGQATAIVQILMGTLIGTLNFEISPDSGTTYYAISGKAVNSSSFASTVTAAGAWEFNVSGFTNFRVRLNPVTSGTSGTITIRLSQGVSNLAVNNASALGANVIANSSAVNIASDQTVPVKGAVTEIAGQGPGVVNAINTDLIPSTDVSSYKWLSLHITGAYVGTLTFQGSNDNANWTNVMFANIINASVASIGSSTGSTNVIYAGPVQFRYFRVRMTSYTSNTSLAGTLELFTSPTSLLGMTVVTAQPGATTTGGSTPSHLVSAASTNATNIKASAGQVYNYNLINTNAAIRYVHLYNKASAPTVGTDVPIKTFLVPATGQISGAFPVGSAFSLGIALSTTVSSADTASDAVGAGDLIIDLETK